MMSLSSDLNAMSQHSNGNVDNSGQFSPVFIKCEDEIEEMEDFEQYVAYEPPIPTISRSQNHQSVSFNQPANSAKSVSSLSHASQLNGWSRAMPSHLVPARRELFFPSDSQSTKWATVNRT